MNLEILDEKLTVCRLGSITDTDLSAEFFFLGRTDEEISLVCRTEDTPEHVTARQDGWRCFRVQGVLDFSLTGILAGITSALADAGIAVFAVSTYNTDYILVKEEQLERAAEVLRRKGYTILRQA